MTYPYMLDGNYFILRMLADSIGFIANSSWKSLMPWVTHEQETTNTLWYPTPAAWNKGRKYLFLWPIEALRSLWDSCHPQAINCLNFIDIHNHIKRLLCPGCGNRDGSFRFSSHGSLRWKWFVAIPKSAGNGEFNAKFLTPTVFSERKTFLCIWSSQDRKYDNLTISFLYLICGDPVDFMFASSEWKFANMVVYMSQIQLLDLFLV